MSEVKLLPASRTFSSGNFPLARRVHSCPGEQKRGRSGRMKIGENAVGGYMSLVDFLGAVASVMKNC